MRHPILLGCLLPMSLAAADLDRETRVLEGGQRSIAANVAGATQDLEGLIQEMINNGVISQDEIDSMRTSSGELAMLVDPKGERTMPWVEARLAAVRASSDRVALGQATEAQTMLIDQLDQLAGKMKRGAAGTAAAAVRQALDRQESLRKDTEKLSDLTVGKRASELSATEKAETQRLAERQREVSQSVQDAIQQLTSESQLAATAGRQPEADRLAQAAAGLTATKAEQLAVQAGSDIKGNQLSNAQDKQAQVAAALRQASQSAGFAAPLSPQQAMAQLQSQINQINALAQQQSANLQAAKTLDSQTSPAAQNQLQAAQANLASQIQQAAQAASQAGQPPAGQPPAGQPSPAAGQQPQAQAGQSPPAGQQSPQSQPQSMSQAAQSAQQAAQQLGQQSQQSQQASQQSMQQALSALQQAQQAAQQQLAALQQQAQAAQQAAAMQALAAQQQALMNQTQQANTPAQMQSLAAQQQAISQALTQAPMQNAATQAAQQASQQAQAALQAGQQPQAQAAQQAALSAMQQAAQQAAQQAGQGQKPGQGQGQKPGQGQAKGQGPGQKPGQGKGQGQGQGQGKKPGSKPGQGKPGTSSAPSSEVPVNPLEDGPRDGLGKQGDWKVALEPAEREILSQSSGERFPDRYEQQLADYYRALAGAKP